MQIYTHKQLIIIMLACTTTGLHTSVFKVDLSTARQPKNVSPLSGELIESPLCALSNSSFELPTPLSTKQASNTPHPTPLHIVWPETTSRATATPSLINESPELHTKLNNLLSNEEIKRMILTNNAHTAFIALIITAKPEKTTILQKERTLKKDQKLQTKIMACRKDAVQALRELYPHCALDKTQICPVTGEIFDIRTYQTVSSAHGLFARN